MSAKVQPRMTPEQYLELERSSEFRNEYYNGRTFAMSGGSFNHARIIANFSYELSGALRTKNCEVASSDLRVRISPGGLYTYPDIVVVCGAPEFADGDGETLVNPILISEVLSPSTEAYDRGFKSLQYRKLETLKEYAIVSQSEPLVEILRRQESGEWLLSEYAGMEATCHFTSIDCDIAMAGFTSRLFLIEKAQLLFIPPPLNKLKPAPPPRPYPQKLPRE